MMVDYVAFDSLGVKSSCVRVKTGDCTIVVDPGIASETGSFPLTGAEKARLRRFYEEAIREACSSSDIIILTHYHYDHHIPDRSLYEGKILLVKDPKNNINRSQMGRARNLLDGLDADIKIADGETFRFGSTVISFSRPVWHGTEGTNLGYIVMVKIEDGDKSLLHTSDVDGPVLKETTDAIIGANPDILILDGPPTYLLGYIMAYYNLARSIINIVRIMEETNTELFILDHHVVRDYRYLDLLSEVYKKADALGKRLSTVAELLNRRPMVLEGYERNGPTKWKGWKPFTKVDMIEVLRNAVENGLVGAEWLEMAEEL